jgi:hypothetical protein
MSQVIIAKVLTPNTAISSARLKEVFGPGKAAVEVRHSIL